MIIQQRVLLKDEHHGKEVYSGLDLYRQSQTDDPYMMYIACMPYGTPFGIYPSERMALDACYRADMSVELVKWRKQNREYGIQYKRQKCSVVALPMFDLILLFNAYGEVIKEPQKDLLLLSEQGGVVLLRDSDLEASKEV